MMKKITLLLILLTVSFGYSQSSPITFEADVTVGVNWNNATGITTSIVDVANTSISGVVNTPANPAGMVGKMMTDSGANPWQEAHLIMTTFGIDLTTLNGGAKTVTVDVYSTTGNDFLLKVINPVGGGGDFSQVAAAHDGTGWEQLTFNFNNATNSAVPDALFTTFVFFPLYDAVAVNFIASADTTTAIDNISFVEGSLAAPPSCSDNIQNQGEVGIDCGGPCPAGCPIPPVIAAPTPPARDPADVISIFSDAYTNVTIDDFDFGLCGTNPSAAEVMIAGNLTQNYLGQNCQGISVETNRIDASEFTSLHFDFYTDVSGPDLIGKVFNIKLVDWAGNETEAGSTGLEVNFNDGTSPGITTGSWVSVDVDITSIGGMVGGNLTRSDIAQIHITSNLPNAWYDNLYLYKEFFEPGTCSDGIKNQDELGIDCGGTISGCAPCSGPPTAAAPTPPARDAADVISIYSDAYTDIAIDAFDFGLCDGSVPDLATAEVMIAGFPAQNYLKPGCQGINFETNRIDASAFTNLHFDFFTNVSGDDLIGKVFNIKLVDWAGNETEAGSTGLEINFNDGTSPGIITSSWVSVDVDLTSFGAMVGGNLTRSDIAQIHITSNLPNAWYDNLYLHKNTTLGIENNELVDFNTYPNPTQENWTVKTKSESISSIKVYDILGKQVLSLSPNSIEATINGTSLNSGLYFAQIKTDSGLSNIKLIKN
jgi:hypothetical protein